MAFSEETKQRALRAAGYRCECMRQCSHHAGRRCNADLTRADWDAHHKTAVAAGGSDALSNCEVLCVRCHQNTRTYGY